MFHIYCIQLCLKKIPQKKKKEHDNFIVDNLHVECARKSSMERSIENNGTELGNWSG